MSDILADTAAPGVTWTSAEIRNEANTAWAGRVTLTRHLNGQWSAGYYGPDDKPELATQAKATPAAVARLLQEAIVGGARRGEIPWRDLNQIETMIYGLLGEVERETGEAEKWWNE